MEVNVLTQSMYHARGLAMTRMEEGNALGADGIVGVRLVITSYEWGESMAEFMAIGTAIRSRSWYGYCTHFNRTSDTTACTYTLAQ